jgi:hypothetical protein
VQRVGRRCLLAIYRSCAAGYDGAHLDTATMRHHGKRSADLRIGVNGRFPPNLAESEFGAPSQCQGAPGMMAAQPLARCLRLGFLPRHTARRGEQRGPTVWNRCRLLSGNGISQPRIAQIARMQFRRVPRGDHFVTSRLCCSTSRPKLKSPLPGTLLPQSGTGRGSWWWCQGRVAQIVGRAFEPAGCEVFQLRGQKLTV